MLTYLEPPRNRSPHGIAAGLGCAVWTLILLVVAGVLLLSLGVTPAFGAGPAAGPDDDRERKVKVAVALQVATEDKCACAKGRLATWDEAAKRGLADRSPIVVFAGTRVRCCADAIPVAGPPVGVGAAGPEDAGLPQIIVYRPTARGTWQIDATLPADATPAQVKAAVAAARKKTDGKDGK